MKMLDFYFPSGIFFAARFYHIFNNRRKKKNENSAGTDQRDQKDQKNFFPFHIRENFKGISYTYHSLPCKGIYSVFKSYASNPIQTAPPMLFRFAPVAED